MHVEWNIVTDYPQVTRKLKEFAKMCCACSTSPKLALQTLVMVVSYLLISVMGKVETTGDVQMTDLF